MNKLRHPRSNTRGVGWQNEHAKGRYEAKKRLISWHFSVSKCVLLCSCHICRYVYRRLETNLEAPQFCVCGCARESEGKREREGTTKSFGKSFPSGSCVTAYLWEVFFPYSSCFVFFFAHFSFSRKDSLVYVLQVLSRPFPIVFSSQDETIHSFLCSSIFCFLCNYQLVWCEREKIQRITQNVLTKTRLEKFLVDQDECVLGWGIGSVELGPKREVFFNVYLSCRKILLDQDKWSGWLQKRCADFVVR